MCDMDDKVEHTLGKMVGAPTHGKVGLLFKGQTTEMGQV